MKFETFWCWLRGGCTDQSDGAMLMYGIIVNPHCTVCGSRLRWTDGRWV